MISLLHAIGSLRTNRGIHGVMPNPVRDLIDDMALNLPNPITTIGLVIDDDSNAIHGAFVQPDGWRECVEQAAALSAAVNIRYVPQRVRRVVAALPQRKDGSWLYPDLWTGAKGVLKTEDAVADGGELVVWAPNIDSISDAHGDLISAIGYHTYAYFLSRPESWQRAGATPLALNGSALMKGEGRMAAGREVPRIDVRIATAIPADECARMNIGYEDPDAVAAEIAAMAPNAITDDRLIVHDAGGVLWRYQGGLETAFFVQRNRRWTLRLSSLILDDTLVDFGKARRQGLKALAGELAARIPNHSARPAGTRPAHALWRTEPGEVAACPRPVNCEISASASGPRCSRSSARPTWPTPSSWWTTTTSSPAATWICIPTRTRPSAGPPSASRSPASSPTAPATCSGAKCEPSGWKNAWTA